MKTEPMPEGKAPRLHIADGAEGQAFALYTDACSEGFSRMAATMEWSRGVLSIRSLEITAKELAAPKSAYGKALANLEEGRRTQK